MNTISAGVRVGADIQERGFRMPEIDTMFQSYYIFDLDDNLAKLHTKIYVRHKNDPTQERTISTEELRFPDFDNKYFLFDGSFRDFWDQQGDTDRFEKDLRSAEIGVMFPDLAKAIQESRPIAILTARAHDPLVTLAPAFKNVFIRPSKNSLIKSMKARGGMYMSMSNDELVAAYVNMCLFAPVTSPALVENYRTEFSAINPKDKEKVPMQKAIVYGDFVEKVIQANSENEKSIYINYSDDDPRNILAVLKKRFFHWATAGIKYDFYSEIAEVFSMAEIETKGKIVYTFTDTSRFDKNTYAAYMAEVMGDAFTTYKKSSV